MINWQIMSWFVTNRPIQYIIAQIRTSKYVQPDTDIKKAIANQECKFIVLVTNEYDIIYTVPDQSMNPLPPWPEDVLDNGFIPKKMMTSCRRNREPVYKTLQRPWFFFFTPVHLRIIGHSLKSQCNHAHAWRYDEHVHSNKPPGIWNDFYQCSQKPCISTKGLRTSRHYMSRFP